MMRIIDTDNLGGDYPDEKFHLFVMSESAAEKICDIINDELGDFTTRYYKTVPDDYKLQPGFTP
jgi:hypothetical protein